MVTLFINGQIFDGNGFIEAFAVDGSTIVATGSTNMLIQRYPDATIVDLKHRFVTAGFNDSHMHVLNYGYGLASFQLAEHTQSLKALQQYVADEIHRRQIPSGRWVRGRGWNHDFFEDGHRFPTRYDLDQISTDHPICLVRACGHACVVNSLALELIHVTKDTPQPQGGAFDVDEHGEPLGIFRENGLDMVYQALPKPSIDELEEMLENAMHHLNAYGVTSAQTDDFVVFHGLDYHDVITAYQNLEAKGKMSVRIYEQNHFTNPHDLSQFLAEGRNSGIGSSWFKYGPLKMLGDGSLGARTAYLSQPYADDGSTTGIAVYDQSTFNQMIDLAHRNGMQIAIHAIGDAIMDRIINAMEATMTNHPRFDARHGIIHCQIMRPDQYQRMKALDLHAYIQSIFLDYDIGIVHQRVNPLLASSSYGFHTMQRLGLHVSNGSDCPVELPDCMCGIQCAVTRKSVHHDYGIYRPEEAMSVADAIRAFTIEGAHASFEESVKGLIAPGYLADFVIWSDDPFMVEPQQIHTIHPLQTYVNGTCVYGQNHIDNQ